MSLRPARDYVNTLAALALGLLLAGCASNKPAQDGAGDGGAETQGGAQDRALMFWDMIEGGPEGNFVTGTRSVRLMRPMAVAARNNYVYIYDAGRYLLYRYDRTVKQLKIIKDLQGLVTGDVESIYVAPNLNFYVADTYGGRVLYFDSDGDLIRIFGDRINLARPVSVDVDEGDGRVLVADGLNDFILEFDRMGNLRRGLGSRGQAQGQFLNITAMAQRHDKLYVGARLGHRLQVLDADGRFLAELDDFARFPTAIAVDRNKRVYVSDYLDNTIKVYGDDGELIDTVGGTGVTPGRFKRITSLWIDEGFLYVADSLNGRVQIMRILD